MDTRRSSNSSTQTDRPDRPSRHDKPGTGRTESGKGGVLGPRLPHERDESSDSQTSVNPSAERVGRQAHADATSPQEDTDLRQETLDELNDRTMPPSDPDAGRRPGDSARRGG